MNTVTFYFTKHTQAYARKIKTRIFARDWMTEVRRVLPHSLVKFPWTKWTSCFPLVIQTLRITILYMLLFLVRMGLHALGCGISGVCIQNRLQTCNTENRMEWSCLGLSLEYKMELQMRWVYVSMQRKMCIDLKSPGMQNIIMQLVHAFCDWITVQIITHIPDLTWLFLCCKNRSYLYDTLLCGLTVTS